MTRVDIISGFLGAGKTTLIKKLLQEALKGEQVVLIENEFGDIGIDGGFLQESGIEIREMNSGCICCSLVGDFTTSLGEVLEQYHPDRIIIEPSGVGKLSDVIVAVQKAMEGKEDVILNSATAVVDVQKCRMYQKNFGEFYSNQIENAGTIVLSRTGICKPAKLEQALEILRGINSKAVVITTDWAKLEGSQILEAMEKSDELQEDMIREMMEAHEAHEQEHHHHHHHEDGEECHCHDHEHEHEHHHHHHHEDGEECHCHDHEHEHEHHHHHHHEDGEECHCHDHEHEHEHEHHHHHGECGCGHDHHADEVFGSWGMETAKKYTAEELERILETLTEGEVGGVVLRAKGMVSAADAETWLYFDMVPEEHEIREGRPQVTGRICVIGSQLKEKELAELFGCL